MATRVIDDGCYICEDEGGDGPYEYAETVVRSRGRVKLYRHVDRRKCERNRRESLKLAAEDYAMRIRDVRSNIEIARQDIADSEAELHDLVRNAISEGVSVTALARAAGLSRERIYQIRDGRRR